MHLRLVLNTQYLFLFLLFLLLLLFLQVVAIWDQRRLICPLSKFLQGSFQNWTRTTEELLGTVFIYVDYTIDVAVMREAAERIIKGAPGWDGR